MMSIKIEIVETGKADELLGKLPLELRGKVLVKAIRKAGNIVAKEARKRIPKPGYAGDKPDKVPLLKTVKVAVRTYSSSTRGYIGPQYPEGAHSHLVEYGHRVVLPEGREPRQRKDGEEPAKVFVQGKPFLRPAADITEAQQQRAIISTLQDEVEKLA